MDPIRTTELVMDALQDHAHRLRLIAAGRPYAGPQNRIARKALREQARNCDALLRAVRGQVLYTWGPDTDLTILAPAPEPAKPARHAPGPDADTIRADDAQLARIESSACDH